MRDKRIKWVGPLLRWLVSLVSGVLILGMAANIWVWSSTRSLVFDDLAYLPVHDVGVVLGTSPFTHTGRRNILFMHRIKAAAQLYHAGKIRHVLVSGANPSMAYNEPRKMYQALRQEGVPDAAITLDFAGFRTLDSIVRARRIFGLESFVIISQRYHDYRALFLAQHDGIQAVGYVWPGEDRRQALRTELREYLARIKAVLDLYVLRTTPLVMGPGVPIAMPVAGLDKETGIDPEKPYCRRDALDNFVWRLIMAC